jgi:hypothetical protein
LKTLHKTRVIIEQFHHKFLCKTKFAVVTQTGVPFQHAKFSRDGNKDVLQIQFQDEIIVTRGRGLEPLCAALERLAVERIRVRPEKYEAIAPNDGIVGCIEIVVKPCPANASK